jgi:hypothetical protein
MSLSLQAVERLFLRLGATYGRDFINKFEGSEISAVKSSWAHELAGYTANMHPIAWALENLPERCPNVIEFRSLCRRAPQTQVLALPEPTADPLRVAAELSKLAAIAHPGAQLIDHKGWAKRIIARHEYGVKVNAYPLRCAREVLGLPLADSKPAEQYAEPQRMAA